MICTPVDIDMGCPRGLLLSTIELDGPTTVSLGMSPRQSRKRVLSTDERSSDVKEDGHESLVDVAAPRRVTRSMTSSDPAPVSPPSTPSSKPKRRPKQTSPYFSSPTSITSPVISTPARKRAQMPADLEPFILAERLRPDISLHRVDYEKKPTDFGLLQELVSHSVWKLIIAVSLLNQTAGKAVRPVLWQMLDRYPTPEALAAADEMELTALLYPIGLYRIRAKRLKAFSALFVEQPPDDEKVYTNKADKHYQPTPISHYPGVGTYCLDSYQIFIAGGGASVTEPRSHLADAPWRSVMPADKELRKYLAWRWAIDGMLWTPEKGCIGPLPLNHELPTPGPQTSAEAAMLSKMPSSPLSKA